MKNNIINNLTDDFIMKCANESDTLSELYVKLGYSSNNKPGKNTRNKIKEKLRNLNIVIKRHKQELPIKNNLNIDTNQIGLIGEAALISACAYRNIRISKPVIEAYPYDYILEKNNKMIRIQVKTSSELTDTGIDVFYISKTRRAADNKIKYYHYKENDFEYFYLYSMTHKEAYFVKLTDVLNTNTISIRKYKTANNQKKKIKYADDYLFDNIIDSIFVSL